MTASRAATALGGALVAIACLAAAGTPARAQDGDLKGEVESLRRELEAVRRLYEERLRAIGQRIQELEAAQAGAARSAGAPGASAIAPAPPSAAPAPGAPGPAATAPAPPASASARAAPAGAPPSPAPPAPVTASAAPPPASAPERMSPLELIRPRQPFALAAPGSGLLFDIGVSGDFVAAFTSSPTDRRDDGTFPGRENRVFPREVSLGFFGRVDPYASAVVRVSAGQGAPDHPGGDSEFTVVLDEANVTLLALPLGITPRFGLMRPRFGILNTVHQDDLPQVDRPVVLRRFFGEEEMDGEVGVEALAVLPWWPFYQEVSVGVFNGDNETAFGHGRINDPLVLGRIRSFFELDEWGGLQVDLSAATGLTEDQRRNTVAGLGLKYKWSPAVGYGFPLVTVATEVLYGSRSVADESGGSRRLGRWGYYVYGQVDWSARWAIGLRNDWTEQPTDRGREWALSPYVQFRPSEFLRFRLQYTHTDSVAGRGRDADEVFLQGSFILGAHPTERF